MPSDLQKKDDIKYKNFYKMEKLKKGEKAIINKLLKIFNDKDFKFPYKSIRKQNQSLKIRGKKRDVLASRLKIYGKSRPGSKQYSMTLGLVHPMFVKGNPLTLSTYTKSGKYDNIHKLLKKLMKIHNPKYKYSSITINKDIKVKFHTDTRNVGPQYSLTIGNFKGNGLFIKIDNKNILLNTHNRWALFYGRRIPHKTANYTGGPRYAIIYYLKKD